MRERSLSATKTKKIGNHGPLLLLGCASVGTRTHHITRELRRGCAHQEKSCREGSLGKNFGERRACELRRITLPRTRVNTSLWMLLEPASALEDEVEPYGDKYDQRKS